MKTVLNFSHPLSDEAKLQLVDLIGNFAEVTVPCQLDLERPLRPQLDRVLDDGLRAVGAALGRFVYTDFVGALVEPEPRGEAHYPVALAAYPDYVIPLGLSYAAAYIGAKLATAQSDAVPPTPPGWLCFDERVFHPNLWWPRLFDGRRLG